MIPFKSLLLYNLYYVAGRSTLVKTKTVKGKNEIKYYRNE